VNLRRSSSFLRGFVGVRMRGLVISGVREIVSVAGKG
jgi:hypothetical protein